MMRRNSWLHSLYRQSSRSELIYSEVPSHQLDPLRLLAGLPAFASYCPVMEEQRNRKVVILPTIDKSLWDNVNEKYSALLALVHLLELGFELYYEHDGVLIEFLAGGASSYFSINNKTNHSPVTSQLCEQLRLPTADDLFVFNQNNFKRFIRESGPEYIQWKSHNELCLVNNPIIAEDFKQLLATYSPQIEVLEIINCPNLNKLTDLPLLPNLKAFTFSNKIPTSFAVRGNFIYKDSVMDFTVDFTANICVSDYSLFTLLERSSRCIAISLYLAKTPIVTFPKKHVLVKLSFEDIKASR